MSAGGLHIEKRGCWTWQSEVKGHWSTRVRRVSATLAKSGSIPLSFSLSANMDHIDMQQLKSGEVNLGVCVFGLVGRCYR